MHNKVLVRVVIITLFCCNAFHVAYAANAEKEVLLSAPITIDQAALATYPELADTNTTLIFKPSPVAMAAFTNTCAATITAEGTTLDRVTVRDFPGDGLCVNAKNVTLKHVHLIQNGQHGLVLPNTAKDTVIYNNAFIKNTAGGLKIDSAQHHLFSRCYFQGPKVKSVINSDSALAAPTNLSALKTEKGFQLSASFSTQPTGYGVYAYSPPDASTPEDTINPLHPSNWTCSWKAGLITCDIKLKKGWQLLLTVDTAKGTTRLSDDVLLDENLKLCSDGSTSDVWGKCAEKKSDSNVDDDSTDCDEGYFYDGDFKKCLPDDEDDSDDEDADDSEDVTCLSAEILINGTCYANMVKKPITPPAFFPPTLPPTTNQTADTGGGGGCSLMVRP